MTITDEPVQVQPADAHPIHCPIPTCPTAGQPVGAMWRDNPANRGAWWATSTHRPGDFGLERAPFTAAQIVLAVHAVQEHDADLDDAQLLLSIATAAQDTSRAAQGRPPLASLAITAGCCVYCSTPLRWTENTGQWLDNLEQTICAQNTRLCENLCRPHHPHGADPACGTCHGAGEVFGIHEPIPILT